MTKIIESRRRFKSRLDAKQDVSRPIPALMGDGAGTIDVPNQPGFVYIRVGDGDLGQAFNNRVPRADNLAIDVGYDPITDPDRRIFQVLSVRMADYAGGGSTIYPNIPNHHESHEFGGGDDVFLSWRRLMGLRVGRPSGFSVTVDEGFILRAGAWLAVLAQTLDLTASKPALATQARYVLIALDAAGVATATNGALVAVGALDISDCPIPAAGEIPLAAIRMYGTQTSIGDTPSAPDIIDLRFPQAASTGSVYLADLEKGTAQYQVITSGANPYPATWSTFYVRGTAGGTTNLAVTNTKTLTLTSADDYNLIAERTGAVIVRTSGGAPAPQIVGDAVGAGNARGQYAVDLQLSRINAVNVASGNYASILGGSGNQASGNYSVVVGGASNIASGINSFVGGGLNAVSSGDYSYSSGSNCQAVGNYSYAIGRSARTGANAGVFIWADSTVAVFNGIVADEFALRARGGFRHAYDDSNYWTAQVSAAGAVTFDATGASAGFAFSKVVTLPVAGLVVTGMARGDLLTGNATPAFARLAKGTANAIVTCDANDTLWSTYFLSGTAGGTTNFAVTNTKTLTLTATDDYNLTVPTTGTAALLAIANVFTAVQTVNLNAVALPAPITGTVVHVGQADTTASRVMIDAFANASQVFVRRAQNTAASPQALAINNIIGGFAGTGYGATGYSASTRVSINFAAAEAWTDAAQGTYIVFSTTPAGGVSTAEKMRLSDGGDLFWTGAGTGLAYGSCYGNEIAWSQAAAAQNTWYNISDTDMTDGHGGLNLVAHDGSGKLTVTNAGRYLINYSVTVEASVANDHIQTGIELNGTGTAIDDGQQHWDSVANKEITMGSTAIVVLAASGYFEISVRTTDANTPTITVSHLNISVIMVGG